MSKLDIEDFIVFAVMLILMALVMLFLGEVAHGIAWLILSCSNFLKCITEAIL